MGEIIKLLKDSSGLTFLQLVTVGLSFLTFPIFTRILTVENYGLLNICNTLILFGVTISKFGLQNSVIKMAPEANHSSINELYSTYILTSMGLIVFVSFLIWLYSIYFKMSILVSGAVLILSGSIFIQTLQNCYTTFFRTEGKISTYTLSGIIIRIGNAILGIILVINWPGVTSILIANIIFGSAILILVVIFSQATKKIKIYHFSYKVAKSILDFGYPFMGIELSSIIMAFIDRFMIDYFVGKEGLGYYAAGYIICQAIADLIRQPINIAFIPQFLRIISQQGEEHGRKFLYNTISILFYIVVPIAIGFNIVRSDLITLLASSKYYRSIEVIPYLIVGLTAFSINGVFSAGFYVKGKSKQLSYIFIFCSLLNIFLNLCLIPIIGIVGAALSSCISYILMDIILFYYSQKYFKINMSMEAFIKPLICGTAMYLFLNYANYIKDFNIYLKIILGCVFYMLFALILDKRIKAEIGKIFTCCCKIT